jgi:hypothetical protein
MDFTYVDWVRFAPALFWAQMLLAAAWLGTIVSVRSLCAQARWMAYPEETGQLATRVFSRWAWSWLALSLLAGAARGLALSAAALHDRPLWGEIALAAAMLIVHVAMWRRATHVAAGDKPHDRLSAPSIIPSR